MRSKLLRIKVVEFEVFFYKISHLARHEEAGVDVHFPPVANHHHRSTLGQESQITASGNFVRSTLSTSGAAQLSRPTLGKQPQVAVVGETGSGTLAYDSKAIQTLDNQRWSKYGLVFLHVGCSLRRGSRPPPPSHPWPGAPGRCLGADGITRLAGTFWRFPESFDDLEVQNDGVRFALDADHHNRPTLCQESQVDASGNFLQFNPHLYCQHQGLRRYHISHLPRNPGSLFAGDGMPRPVGTFGRFPENRRFWSSDFGRWELDVAFDAEPQAAMHPRSFEEQSQKSIPRMKGDLTPQVAGESLIETTYRGFDFCNCSSKDRGGWWWEGVAFNLEL